MAAIGPTLPDLARQTARSLGEVGRIFIAIFGGSLLAQVFGGPVSDRFGRRVVLVAGLALFSVGALGVAVSHRMLWMLISAVVFGVGYGGCTLAVNVLSAELAPERRASTVNLVNLFYAAGAIAGPLLAGIFLERYASAMPTIWLSAALMLLLLPVSLWAVPASAAPRGSQTSRVIGLDAAMPFVASLGFMLALYVGSESSLGAWAPVYLQRSAKLDAAGAATSTAVFWLALCGGRLLATLAGMRVSAERLLMWSFAGAVGGGVLLVAGHGVASVSVLALAILGLAFGPIYPTGIAIVTGRFPESAGAATSRVGLVAAMGGMAMPWIQGLVLTRQGTRASALVTLAVLVAMAGMWWVVRRVEPAAGRAA